MSFDEHFLVQQYLTIARRKCRGELKVVLLGGQIELRNRSGEKAYEVRGRTFVEGHPRSMESSFIVAMEAGFRPNVCRSKQNLHNNHLVRD